MTERDVWQIAARELTSAELHALTLHIAGEKSYRQIAAELDISHAAVYDRIARAKRKLAAALDNGRLAA